MFSGRIDNCFDSHVHWQATGEMVHRLILRDLKSASDVKSCKADPHFFRGEWLIGFGWDQNNWQDRQFPKRQILDEAFDSKTPVCFSRGDGHAVWVNTEALRRAGLLTADGKVPNPLPPHGGGKILRDADGVPTGVLLDTATQLIDKIIPQPTTREMRSHLLKGALVLNQAGFTHIRDMSCSAQQWQQACCLEDAGLLTLAVEQFFGADDPADFDSMLNLAKAAASEDRKLLRAKGPKVYLDGALGSEGALLSDNYLSGSGKGLRLLTHDQLVDFMQRTWAAKLEFALHVIGDEAAHMAMVAYHEAITGKVSGRLHLEHVELLRPETVSLMAGQNVACHMQPCHWLSDSAWLEKKIGSLSRYAFQWRALQDAGIDFDFGSDSPIERPSLSDNYRALQESAQAGVPKLLGELAAFQSHPSYGWVPNCFSVFEDGHPGQVVFNGEHPF